MEEPKLPEELASLLSDAKFKPHGVLGMSYWLRREMYRIHKQMSDIEKACSVLACTAECRMEDNPDVPNRFLVSFYDEWRERFGRAAKCLDSASEAINIDIKAEIKELAKNLMYEMEIIVPEKYEELRRKFPDVCEGLEGEIEKPDF